MKATRPSTKRKLKPRPPVTAMPLMVSDLTSFELVGLTDRQFRDFLVAHPELPRTRIGHRVLVRADALLALLDRLAADSGGEVDLEEIAQPESADEVLRRLGMRRKAS